MNYEENAIWFASINATRCRCNGPLLSEHIKFGFSFCVLVTLPYRLIDIPLYKMPFYCLDCDIVYIKSTCFLHSKCKYFCIPWCNVEKPSLLKFHDSSFFIGRILWCCILFFLSFRIMLTCFFICCIYTAILCKFEGMWQYACMFLSVHIKNIFMLREMRN